MAALVQSLPSPTTAPMMSGRPSSAQGLQHGYRQPAPGRYKAATSSSYRAMPPYAFTSTPQLSTASGRASQPQQQQQQSLTLDLSSVPALDLSLPFLAATPAAAGSPGASTPTAAATASTAAAAKPSPDRYRRNARRVDSGDSESSRAWSVSGVYSSPALSQTQSYRGSTYAAPSKASADDTVLNRCPAPELAARYRRRSLGSLETAGLNHSHDGPDAASPHPNSVILPPQQQQPQQLQQPQAAVALQRPSPTHAHKNSTDSVLSSRSGISSRPASSRNDKAIPSPAPVLVHPSQAVNVKPEPRHLAPAPRPAESAKRMPSPLSKPVTADSPVVDETPRRIGVSSVASRAVSSSATTSAAAEQLTSVNQGLGPGKKPISKLRRAFSFSSTTELRKATAQASLEKSAAVAPNQPSKRNSKYEDEMEPEQARIAQKQEAAGLGESIYSGQGTFFTGSTDNLSISSTASSASLMLRKMGHGVKKSTRSFVGLFRPKSMIGPSPDGPTAEAPAARVSIVNVEAERDTATAAGGAVNEHLDSLNQSAASAGTATSASSNSLKLERDSIDTGKFSADSATVSSDSRSRRSIVGGEKERAEVLAAVKKGILKRTDSNQPSPRMGERQPDFGLPQIPTLNDSPRSSAPSTPADEPMEPPGQRRKGSVTIEDGDSDGYFASVAHFATIDTMSVGALTPQTMMRNISFSPRIQFHDTWPSAEYDRRGDIATCNRLTPMLAQQIKEELNTFKMEMEVHESSKVYTHFF